MKFFKDSKNREWMLNLTLADAMRIKARLDVDILSPENKSGDYNSLADRLVGDELLLAQIIACMLEKQFEKYSLTEDQVMEEFDAQTLEASAKAFFEEMIDFFQQRGRPDRSKLFQRISLLLKKGIELIDEKLSSLNTEKELMELQKKADEIFGTLSGNAPE